MPKTMLTVWYRRESNDKNTYKVHKTMYRYVPLEQETENGADTEMQILFRGTRTFPLEVLPSKVKGKSSLGENYRVEESYVTYLQSLTEVDIFNLDPQYLYLELDTTMGVISSQMV